MKLYGAPPTRAVRVQWLINELGIDCDVVVTESAAIQLYLAEKYPQMGLIPSGLADRAQMYRWIFFLVTEIEPPLWRMRLNTAFYAEKDRVPADIKNASRDCKQMIAVFEKHMTGREFVVGNRLSVADFNAAFTLDWANEAGMLDDAPRLRAYLATMYARPSAPMTLKQSMAANPR